MKTAEMQAVAGPQDHQGERAADGPTPSTGRGGVARRATHRLFPLLPWLTFGLIAVNIAVEVAAGKLGGAETTTTLIFFGAKANSLIEAGDYWRLVSANFLHIGWLHLAANMVGLFSLGWLVEVFYGRPRFLILYTLTAVAGAITSYLFQPGLSAGASTAVFGLMGVVAAHNLKYRRYLPPALLARMGVIFPLILLQLMLGFRDPRIDLHGHLGGLVAGFFLALVTDSRIAGPLQGAREWLPFPAALATAVALLVYGLVGWIANIPRETPLLLAGIAQARGAEGSAVRYYQIAVRRQPELVEARAELAELLVRQERWWEAGEVLAQLARDQPGHPAYAEAAQAVLDRAAADSLRRGAYDEAAALYRLALQAPPPGRGQAQVQNNLAYVLADKLNRDLAEALRMAEAATQAKPTQGDFIDTLAWVHYRMGEFAAAERYQREAVRVQGDDPEVRYHLGAILQARDKRAAAAVEYEAAIRLEGRRDDRDAKTAVRLAREGLRRLRNGQAL